jgi:hypothetical protein
VIPPMNYFRVFFAFDLEFFDTIVDCFEEMRKLMLEKSAWQSRIKITVARNKKGSRKLLVGPVKLLEVL